MFKSSQSRKDWGTVSALKRPTTQQLTAMYDSRLNLFAINIKDIIGIIDKT